MIIKGNIKQTLRELDSLYRKDISGKYTIYFSKLAHLELCGWIELAQDEIINLLAKNMVFDSVHLKSIKTTIKNNSNMGHTSNFKTMIKEVVGYSGFERIDNLVDPVHKTTLEVELENLKSTRNAHAHTNVKNCTKTLDAPSVNLARMEKIFDALKDYERKIKSLKP